MNMLRCVLKAAKREKSKPVGHFKGSDDIFDTKTLNLAVLSRLPCVINLLLRIVAGLQKPDKIRNMEHGTWNMEHGKTRNLEAVKLKLHKCYHFLVLL